MNDPKYKSPRRMRFSQSQHRLEPSAKEILAADVKQDQEIPRQNSKEPVNFNDSKHWLPELL